MTDLGDGIRLRAIEAGDGAAMVAAYDANRKYLRIAGEWQDHVLFQRIL
ncbi:hypothetical protein ACSS7Z_10320 [Microbacterium sp. A82]